MSGFFSTYNARFLDLRTVAETFVLRNEEFNQLIELNHSLIIGPRGSGKTTLLKMLKITAQLAWRRAHPTSPANQSPQFSAIYVGADRQLDYLLDPRDTGALTTDLKGIFSKGLLAARVRFACLDTLAEVADERLLGSPLEELHFAATREAISGICRSLSLAWRVPEATSPLELRLRLGHQIADLNAAIEALRDSSSSPLTRTELLSRYPFLADDPIQACSAFVDVMNDGMKSPERRWALCIDELEILPTAIEQELFNSFRSKDQRILLKLATSPFSGLTWDRSEPDRPMEGNDFTPISLTFASKRDARRFSARLLDNMIERHFGLDNTTNSQRPHRATSILGRSPITEANTSDNQKDAYRRGGIHYERFSRLLERDVAFMQFMQDRGAQSVLESPSSERQRASLLRKYIWQVAVRLEYGPLNQFRRPDTSSSMRSPSRKSYSDIYLGYDSLMSVCEGNPRVTIGLFSPMLRRTGSNGRIDQSVQADALGEAIAKYVALLSAIPLDDDSGRNTSSIVDLLDSVGEFFYQEVNGPIFKAEPALSIRVDKKTPKKYLDAIGRAVNQGALIMISDHTGAWEFGSLIGARLRLSYLLCPRYHLPLVLGQQTNLSRVLDEHAKGKRKALFLGDLFDERDRDA